MAVPVWLFVMDWIFTMIFIIWGMLIKMTNTPKFIKELEDIRKDQGIK